MTLFIAPFSNGSGGTFDGRQVPLHIRREKTKVLRQWLIDNENNSYPYKQEKEYLSWQSDMSVAQVSDQWSFFSFSSCYG